MQPNATRRVHGAEFKSRVLAECRQAGVSVAAVAMAHGLNVNLVRKWLIGRGLKRMGLVPPAQVTQAAPPQLARPATPLQFVALKLAAADGVGGGTATVVAGAAEHASVAGPRTIDVELRRGSTQLTVRWPSSQADACTAWLRELTGALE